MAFAKDHIGHKCLNLNSQRQVNHWLPNSRVHYATVLSQALICYH